MIRVLLDTCVLSELQRPEGNLQVRARVGAFDPALVFVSVITIAELVKGVARLPPSNRQRTLATWLFGLEHRFGDHILPVDIEVARRWGQLTALAQSQGFQIEASDGLIAATALRHGLHVVTRNTKHFAATGASIIDPWDETSP